MVVDITVMVLSTVKSRRDKEDAIVHYCGFCGTAFFKIEDVIVCEAGHKSAPRKNDGIKKGTLF